MVFGYSREDSKRWMWGLRTLSSASAIDVRSCKCGRPLRGSCVAAVARTPRVSCALDRSYSHLNVVAIKLSPNSMQIEFHSAREQSASNQQTSSEQSECFVGDDKVHGDEGCSLIGPQECSSLGAKCGLRPTALPCKASRLGPKSVLPSYPTPLLALDLLMNSLTFPCLSLFFSLSYLE